MKQIIYGLSAAAALLLVGCGSSSDSTSATDVFVERGPLLYATVTDAEGQQARMQGSGLYRFAKTPAYPVTSTGGVIDMNRNNVIDEGDLNATNLRLTTMQGDAVTVVSSLAVRTELRTMLQETFQLSEAQIFGERPSTDKQIAAVSDEVFKYCIENNISNPAAISLQQMEGIQAQIAERIQYYGTAAQNAAELEQALVRNELAMQGMTQNEARIMEQHMNGAASSSENNSSSSGGSSSSQGAYSSQQGDGSCSSCSSAQSSLQGTSVLTDEQKYTLAYMWNEEKMAKELYLVLNALWESQTLYNIATKAETTHMASVEGLIAAYDLNITNTVDFGTGYSEAELAAYGQGSFSLPALQELYDTLYTEGAVSLQNALQVGCKVEVNDVNDLNRDIETAAGADDLVAVFESLRSGSYNHYWGFDAALKALGITEGCCVLGEDYCKTAEEYPSVHGK